MQAFIPQNLSVVHYFPVLTTLISALFCLVLLRRHQKRGGTHHLWWALGIFAYGSGTALESCITLLGNSIFLTKAWYVAGALWGGYPLAQGSVYFHLKRRTAHFLTLTSLPVLIILSVLVFASPVQAQLMETFRPSGDILEWQWIRIFTPFVNFYAVIFLIGTAAWSAWSFARRLGGSSNRAIGNALIAFGALLPGIGGGMAKAGSVEALYVGELFGIIFIWIGYSFCVRPKCQDDTLGARLSSQVKH